MGMITINDHHGHYHDNCCDNDECWVLSKVPVPNTLPTSPSSSSSSSPSSSVIIMIGIGWMLGPAQSPGARHHRPPALYHKPAGLHRIGWWWALWWPSSTESAALWSCQWSSSGKQVKMVAKNGNGGILCNSKKWQKLQYVCCPMDTLHGNMYNGKMSMDPADSLQVSMTPSSCLDSKDSWLTQLII